jgi:hypothetical protein
MSFVVKRESAPLQSYYKERTNAEQVRFLSAQSGDAYIFEMSAVVAVRAARGITIPTGAGIPANTIDVELPFNYFVGLKNIQVWSINVSTGVMSPIIRKSEYPGLGTTVDTVLDPNAVSFDEVRSDQVRIYNAFAGDIFRVGFNHTAAPAELGEKQIIKNQPDNIGLELEGDGDGIVLKTPAGRRVRLTVNDGLTLSVEEL